MSREMRIFEKNRRLMTTLKLQNEANDGKELLMGSDIEFDCYSSGEVDTENENAIGLISINIGMVPRHYIISYAYWLLSETFYSQEDRLKKIDELFIGHLEQDKERLYHIQNTSLHFNITRHHARHLKAFFEAMVAEHDQSPPSRYASGWKKC